MSSRTPGVGSIRARTRSNAETGTPSSAATRGAQARREIDLAAHRRLRSGLHFGAPSGFVGKQLDHLIADEGGIGIEDDEETGGSHPSSLAITGTVGVLRDALSVR